MLTHFMLVRGVSWDSSWVCQGVYCLIYSSSVSLLGSAFVHIFGSFYCNHMPSSPKSPQSQKTLGTEDVLERFKSYLDHKVESFAWGLVSQTRTQKLETTAEAGKLKFQSNIDQFLFNSELQGILDKTSNFLAARDVERARWKNWRKVYAIVKRLSSLLITAKPVGWQSKNTTPRSSRKEEL